MPRSKPTKKGASVVIADNSKFMRQKVVELLRTDFDVVGAAEDGGSALGMVALIQPDIAVLDISMPQLTGIEIASSLRERGSKTKVVILTVHDDPDYLRAALDAGVLGYVLKSEMATDLVAALQSAVAGGVFVSPRCTLSGGI